jgi:hypothetical protein
MQPDQYGIVFMLVLLALFVGTAVWSVLEWRKKEAARLLTEQSQDSRRAALAREHGWRYAYTPKEDVKYRFNGSSPGGTPWEIQFDLDAASSSSAPTLQFRAGRLRTERMSLLIGDAQAYEVLKAGTGAKMLSAAKFLLDRLSKGKLGEMVDFYAQAHSQKYGEWMVATRSSVGANAPAWRPILERLNQWPRDSANAAAPAVGAKSVDICQDRDGLVITIRTDAPDVARIEHLAKLGITLCAILEAH